MATPNSINFFQPGTDAAVDQNQLLRQREIAALMMKQGMTPQQGQMVSGHFVAPSALSYVAQLANAAGGAYMNRNADAKERQIAEQLRARNAQEAQEFMSAAQGSPAQPGRSIAPLTPNDDEGNAMPVAQAQGTPAVPADMSRAIAIALNAQNPTLAGMVPGMMKQQMEDASFQNVVRAAGGGAPGASMPDGAPPAAGGGTSGPPMAGGNTFGLDPAAFAFSQSKDPRAVAIAKMIQENSKPIALAEGGTALTRGPNGQLSPGYIAPKTEPGIGVVPVPGQPGQFQANPVQNYAQAKANIAGLTAAAEGAERDKFATPIVVQSASGPRLMTPAQARAEAQGSAPPPAMMGAGAPANYRTEPDMKTQAGGGGFNNPAAAANITGAADREIASIQKDLATKPLDPSSRQMLQQQLDDLQKQRQAVAPDAAQAQPTPGAGRGVQGGAGIPLESESSSAYNKERAKGFAEQAGKIQTSGSQAASTLRNLDQLETLYKDPNVAKGALAENISGLKNLGASFGVDMKGLSSEQAAEAITNKMSLEARSTADGGGMPGAMSDADRNFLKNMQPGLNKTAEGRALIIDAARKTAQRQLDVARMATEYEQTNGRLDAGFDKVVRDYAAKNQLFTQPKKGGGFRVLSVQ